MTIIHIQPKVIGLTELDQKCHSKGSIWNDQIVIMDTYVIYDIVSILCKDETERLIKPFLKYDIISILREGKTERLIKPSLKINKTKINGEGANNYTRSRPNSDE